MGSAGPGDFLKHSIFQNPKEVCVSQRKLKRPGGAVGASPDELVRSHRDLVIHVARDFERRLPPSITFGDLVGAGSLGLVEAARRFNARAGASFPTFARHRIRGAIVDSLRRIDPLSRRLRSFQKASSQAAETLTMTLGRRPSDSEVAAHIGLAAGRFERLSRELHEAGGGVQTEIIVHPVDQFPARSRDPERLAEVAELRDSLNDALGTLPGRYRAVIRWYHFDGLTMRRIGVKLGISEGRVSQIHSGAIRRLREHARLREHV